MEIRHLRYFVTVAETLNFGRAARLLRMSQPPLSKRIADLEAELGQRLFDRTNRHVALSEAGRALLPHARHAVEAFDAALRSSRAVAPAQTARMRIGFPPDTSPPVLLDLRRQLIAASIDVDIGEATTAEQHALLVSGELDMGVLRHPYDSTGLLSSPSLRQTLGVVLPQGHPLATRDALRLRDLQQSTLVIFPRSIAPGLHDELLDTCRHGGYAPRRIVNGVRMTAALLVAESAVTFSTERGYRVPMGSALDLVWKPLAGEPLHWWTSVVWRRVDDSSTKRMAASLILQALQAHDHWQPMARPARRRARRTQTLA